jgi:hypothetical protein
VLKSYKGLKEATHVYILKLRGQGDIAEYLLDQNDLTKKIRYRQNEVITNLKGI